MTTSISLVMEKEPWTRWQGNKRSQVVFVGNEYVTPERQEKALQEYEGLPAPGFPTNAHLMYLLQFIRIPVPPPPRSIEEANDGGIYGSKGLLYFTNQRLCHGKCTFKQQLEELREARLVVTLGKPAWENISKIAKGKDKRPFKEVRGKLQRAEIDTALGNRNIEIFPVYHPSFLREEQIPDWKLLGEEVRKLNLIPQGNEDLFQLSFARHYSTLRH